MWGWGGGWWMMIFWVLFWIAIIVLVIYLIRQLGSRPSAHPPKSAPLSPLEVLQLRYARGEISTEEYEERRRIRCPRTRGDSPAVVGWRECLKEVSPHPRG